MFEIAVLAFGVLVAATAALILIGPERLWSMVGPADLGTVDFSTLERRKSPNDALACPPGKFKAESDISSPTFSINAAGLRAAMDQVIASEPRVTKVASVEEGQSERYIQRSALLRFPDTVVVHYFDLPGEKSTLAIYSRSQLGYSDMGQNKARIERWLKKLRKIAPPAEQ